MPRRTRGGLIRFLVLLAAIPVTVMLALLLVPEDHRNSTFFITVASIMVAETAALGYPGLLEPRTGVETAMRIGAGRAIRIYGVGVVALALAAVAGLAFKLLLIGEMVWLFALIAVLLLRRERSSELAESPSESAAPPASE